MFKRLSFALPSQESCDRFLLDIPVTREQMNHYRAAAETAQSELAALTVKYDCVHSEVCLKLSPNASPDLKIFCRTLLQRIESLQKVQKFFVFLQIFCSTWTLKKKKEYQRNKIYFTIVSWVWEIKAFNTAEEWIINTVSSQNCRDEYPSAELVFDQLILKLLQRSSKVTQGHFIFENTYRISRSHRKKFLMQILNDFSCQDDWLIYRLLQCCSCEAKE